MEKKAEQRFRVNLRVQGMETMEIIIGFRVQGVQRKTIETLLGFRGL